MFGSSSTTADNKLGSGSSFGSNNNPLFGGKKDDNKSSAFTLGSKPENNEGPKAPFFAANNDTSKPATSGFLFGAKKDEDKPASGGFLLSVKKDDDKDKPTTSGLSFGAKKDDNKPASGGFSFGAKKDEDKAASGGGFTFGAKKDDDKDKPASGGFSFGQKSDDKKEDKSGSGNATSATTASTATTTTTTAQPNLKPTKIEPIPVSIDNKTLDDLIVKWSKQLTTTTKVFDSYTTKVKEWDQKLVESGDDITKLNQESLEAETLQSKINQQLLFVENQQDELEKILDNYEQQADILLNNMELNNNEVVNAPSSLIHAVDGSNKDTNSKDASASVSSSNPAASGGSSSSLSITDKLRENAYHNAELLDERLDNLGANLGTLINEINSVSDVFNKNLINELANKADARDSTSKKDDIKPDENNPIEEIVRLLNLHLENLKYIENAEEELKSKLEKLNKTKKLNH